LRRSRLIKLATVAACFGAAALWPSGALAETYEWVHIANEGRTLTTAQDQWGTKSTVRYGAQGHYTYKNINGSAPCTNAFFGRDPNPGVPKYCDVAGHYYMGPEEGQLFDRFNPTPIAYGQSMSGIRIGGGHPPDEAAGGWAIKTVVGAASCTNSYFGVDPWPGVKKFCYVSDLAPPMWLLNDSPVG
jgi:hypothetical protein